MQRQPYIGEPYEISSIDYLKGILHTYADINEHSSGLSYDFDLITIGKSNDVISLIKEQFNEFREESFQLKLLEEETFLSEIKSWLYLSGNMTILKVAQTKQDEEVNHLYKLFNKALMLNEIYKITELSDSYQFGISSDYYILNGASKYYLMYFLYTD
ncbi:hypothetical protein DBR40_13180 [Pedobacter sp. KBW01]|uniref:hypothetical protein n=1 Tax=Pedobacter sp. KBW01 TaxID=2153364 RepID=UPI000F59EED0|nr:hypothetical protein [Pedobacter sp. KBW01]RQO73757.1 hypothetical protein DBR40_13180 [Pedobacter sp. KBW01]